MEIMDGKKLRDELLLEYKEKIEQNNYKIKLAIILVGNNDASLIYVRNKVKYCEQVGIIADLYHLSDDTTEQEVIDLITKLNNDNAVTGIILQSPVTAQIDFDKCAELIKASKDIDGFTKESTNQLYHNQKGLMPCTVKGIIKLLDYYKIELTGKHAVVIGRGDIVGKPLALALLNRNATVTLCHSKTENLGEITKQADIIIGATGRAKLVTADMVKDGFVGVDAGISRDENGKMCGDFDYENIKNKASFITPVPGGVGPMTIAMIIDNLIDIKEGE